MIEIDSRKIRKIREERGMTRVQLSAKTGVPIRTLENWELTKQKDIRDIDRLNRVVEALQCSIKDLYEDKQSAAVALVTACEKQGDDKLIDVLEKCIKKIPYEELVKRLEEMENEW